MHTQVVAPFDIGSQTHSIAPGSSGISLAAVRGRKSILLNLHRYLEGDVTRDWCLRELERCRAAMTVEEQCILDAPDNLISRGDMRGTGQLWLESATTIMWGLGELDRLPPFDTSCYPFEHPVAHHDPCPRSIDELAMAKHIALIWTMRALLWSTGKGDSAAPPGHVYPLRLSAGMYGVIELMEGDLMVMGTFPIHALTVDDCSFIAAISGSRLHALNWLLCGNASHTPRWDDPRLNYSTEAREPV